MSQFDLKTVNKFVSHWNVNTLFRDINVRAIIREEEAIILQLILVSKIRKKLTEDLGPEGDLWFISFSDHENKDEVYIQKVDVLLLWKLQDFENFCQTFERIEQHKS